MDGPDTLLKSFQSKQAKLRGNSAGTWDAPSGLIPALTSSSPSSRKCPRAPRGFAGATVLQSNLPGGHVTQAPQAPSQSPKPRSAWEFSVEGPQFP